MICLESQIKVTSAPHKNSFVCFVLYNKSDCIMTLSFGLSKRKANKTQSVILEFDEGECPKMQGKVRFFSLLMCSLQILFQ